MPGSRLGNIGKDISQSHLFFSKVETSNLNTSLETNLITRHHFRIVPIFKGTLKSMFYLGWNKIN